MDEQSKKCVACNWCCEYIQIPILPDKESVELYHLRGDDLIYLTETKEWYIRIKQPCQYLTEKGCGIYPEEGEEDKRASLCGKYMCQLKDKGTRAFSDQQVEATRGLIPHLLKIK